ncbi:MAG: hypothetical protein ACRDZQ_09980, partial [Acidimicrobiales bacterium]
ANPSTSIGTAPPPASSAYVSPGTGAYSSSVSVGPAVAVPVPPPVLASTTTTVGLPPPASAGTPPPSAGGGSTRRSPAYLVEAFDQVTGRWSRLHPARAGGSITAAVPRPADHLGPSGALLVRVVATGSHLLVQGDPTVSAQPAPGGAGP